MAKSGKGKKNKSKNKGKNPNSKSNAKNTAATDSALEKSSNNQELIDKEQQGLQFASDCNDASEDGAVSKTLQLHSETEDDARRDDDSRAKNDTVSNTVNSDVISGDSELYPELQVQSNSADNENMKILEIVPSIDNESTKVNPNVEVALSELEKEKINDNISEAEVSVVQTSPDEIAADFSSNVSKLDHAEINNENTKHEPDLNGVISETTTTQGSNENRTTIDAVAVENKNAENILHKTNQEACETHSDATEPNMQLNSNVDSMSWEQADIDSVTDTINEVSNGEDSKGNHMSQQAEVKEVQHVAEQTVNKAHDVSDIFGNQPSSHDEIMPWDHTAPQDLMPWEQETNENGVNLTESVHDGNQCSATLKLGKGDETTVIIDKEDTFYSKNNASNVLGAVGLHQNSNAVSECLPDSSTEFKDKTDKGTICDRTPKSGNEDSKFAFLEEDDLTEVPNKAEVALDGAANSSAEGKLDKFEFLEEDDELLLDDIMDDDLLEAEEPATNSADLTNNTVVITEDITQKATKYLPEHSQPSIPTLSHSTYTPNMATYSQFSNPHQSLAHELNEEKKRSDAYDFPQDLLKKSLPKPAKEVKQNVYTQIESSLLAQKSNPFHPPSSASISLGERIASGGSDGYTTSSLPPLPIARQGSRYSSQMSSPQNSNSKLNSPQNKFAPTVSSSSSSKNFFEELPLPKIERKKVKNPYANIELSNNSRMSQEIPSQQPNVKSASSLYINKQANPYAPSPLQDQHNLPTAAPNIKYQVPQNSTAIPSNNLPPLKKTSNPYAPAAAGGHIRQLSTTTPADLENIKPNIIPVPMKSPLSLSNSQPGINSPITSNVPNTGYNQFHNPHRNVSNRYAPPLAQEPINEQLSQQQFHHQTTAPSGESQVLTQQSHKRANSFGRPRNNSRNRVSVSSINEVYGSNIVTSNATSTGKRKTMTLPPNSVKGKNYMQPSSSFTPAPTVINPENLVRRQWPLFCFSAEGKAVSMIPKFDGYGHINCNIKVLDIGSHLKLNPLDRSFPGPLNKSKTKKKDVIKWLDEKISSNFEDVEALIWKCLKAMVEMIEKPGDFTNEAYVKRISSILNPDLNVSSGMNNTFDIIELTRTVQSFAPNKPCNAFSLDNSGLSAIHGMLKVGDKKSALQYAIAEGDWTIALLVANLMGPIAFAQTIKLYSTTHFPSNPLGDDLSFFVQSASKDGFSPEQMKGKEKWLIDNFKIVIPFIIMDNVEYGPILLQLGENLVASGFKAYGKLALILSGLPLIPKSLSNLHLSFSDMVVEEIYEYILLSSGNVPPNFAQGFAHLIPVKIHHASYLADIGSFMEAKRYVDTTQVLINSKQFFCEPATIVAQNALNGRLAQVGTGWLSSKLSRPQLDRVWTTLDKSFNKFVSGEDVPPPTVQQDGVFSKFTSPATLSRAASTLDLSDVKNSMTNIPNNITSSPAYLPGMNRTPTEHGSVLYGAPANTSIRNAYAPPSKYTETVRLLDETYDTVSNSAIPQSTTNYNNTEIPETLAKATQCGKIINELEANPYAPPPRKHSNHDLGESYSMLQKAEYTPPKKGMLSKKASRSPYNPYEPQIESFVDQVPSGATQSITEHLNRAHPASSISSSSGNRNLESLSVPSIPIQKKYTFPPQSAAITDQKQLSHVSATFRQEASDLPPLSGSITVAETAISTDLSENLSLDKVVSSGNMADIYDNKLPADKLRSESQAFIEPVLAVNEERNGVSIVRRGSQNSVEAFNMDPVEHMLEDDHKQDMVDGRPDPVGDVIDNGHDDNSKAKPENENDEQAADHLSFNRVKPENTAVSETASGSSMLPVSGGDNKETYQNHEFSEAINSETNISDSIINAKSNTTGNDIGHESLVEAHDATESDTKNEDSLDEAPKVTPDEKVEDMTQKPIDALVHPSTPKDIAPRRATINRYGPPGNSTNPRKKPVNPYASAYTPKTHSHKSTYAPPAETASQELKATASLDTGIPSDLSGFDMFSYGGYTIPKPTAPQPDSPNKTENGEGEKMGISETSIDTENATTDSALNDGINDVSAVSEESSFVPTYNPPKQTGMRSRLETSTHQNNLTDIFVEPSPFGKRKLSIPASPIHMFTEEKRYVAEDTGVYYDDVIEDSDEEADVKQKREEEEEKMKKEAEEKARKEKEEEDLKRKKEQESKKTGNNKGESGWFSWLGKKSDKPKPIKAKLGEENSFYYDEKLKRWINKKAPLDEQLEASKPPPPPMKKNAVTNPSTPLTPKPKHGSSSLTATSASSPSPDIYAPTPVKKGDDIDSLLKMSGAGGPPKRGARRGPRRGYVDVMSQK